MSKHTIVLEFDGGEPSYSASMELLGGRIVAVAFADEMERCEQVESERDDLLEALEGIIASSDAGNAAIFDRLIEPARAAIARARGEV